MQVRDWPSGKQLYGNRLRGAGGQQADHEPAMCFCDQKGQWHPGMHQEECDKQVEGGFPPLLLCSGEALTGVLCPVLGFPVQRGHGTAWEDTAKGYKDNKGIEHLSYEERPRGMGLFSMEKTESGSYQYLQILRVGVRKMGPVFFWVVHIDKTRGSGYKLEHRKFYLNMWRNFFSLWW